jgi:hypothetical protein
MSETKTVYVAYTNTDCTEGRGFDVPIAVCEIEATAKRIACGRYVQGTDGPVRELKLVKIDGKWYVPSSAVNVIPPAKEDVETQRRLDAQRAVYEKARTAGLTDEEIQALRGQS